MFHKDSPRALYTQVRSRARNALAAAKQATSLKSEPYENGLYKRAHKDRMMIAKIGLISQGLEIVPGIGAAALSPPYFSSHSSSSLTLM